MSLCGIDCDDDYVESGGNQLYDRELGLYEEIHHLVYITDYVIKDIGIKNNVNSYM